MIVVIGSIGLDAGEDAARPVGLAGSIALAAAVAGASVELIAKVGDDAVGDRLLIALARAGVGHAAVLRDPVHPTPWRADSDGDPVAVEDESIPDAGTGWTVPPSDGPRLDAADVALALRYVTDRSVVVAVHLPADVLGEARAAADWSEAHLVVVTGPGDGAPNGLPAGSLALSSAEDDADGSGLGARIGAYAAAVDRGDDQAVAFASLTADVAAG